MDEDVTRQLRDAMTDLGESAERFGGISRSLFHDESAIRDIGWHKIAMAMSLLDLAAGAANTAFDYIKHHLKPLAAFEARVANDGTVTVRALPPKSRRTKSPKKTTKRSQS